jgi:general secretion pathway protein K
MESDARKEQKSSGTRRLSGFVASLLALAGRKPASRHVARLRRRRANKRGVALLMVLSAITVLAIFLSELQEQTSADLSAALAERDVLRAEYAARSAVNLSRMLIASEPIVTQPLAMLRTFVKAIPPQIPIWLYSDVLLGPFNDPGAQAAFGTAAGLDFGTAKNIGLNGASFRIKIVDEEGMPVNANLASGVGTPNAQVALASTFMQALAGPQYDPLFDNSDADGQFSDRMSICSALLDFSDWDENLASCNVQGAPPSGAEDNFYQTIGLPYMRKNAAFDSLEELRMVRGFSDDFWSTFVDPDPADPSQRRVTVWGRDKVNPNSMSPIGLYIFICQNAVPGESPLCDAPVDPTNPTGSPAQQFLMALSMMKSVLPPGVPYVGSAADLSKSLQGTSQSPLGMVLAMSGVPMPAVKIRSESEFKKRIDMKSRIFSIYGEGIVKGYFRETRVRIHAVVDMRDAGAPPGIDLNGLTGGGGSGGAGGSGGTGSTSLTPQPALGSPEEQLGKDPGGRIIYWRIE